MVLRLDTTLRLSRTWMLRSTVTMRPISSVRETLLARHRSSCRGISTLKREPAPYYAEGEGGGGGGGVTAKCRLGSRPPGLVH